VLPEPTVLPTPTAPPAAGASLTGAQVLVAEDFVRLAGKRVGLITGRVAAPAEGALIDLLAAHPDVDLVAAFAPEHGIRGDLDAGELVEGTIDPATGIPIISLYGADRAPKAQDLAGIDVLVYDLQDVGARFYTYISTMGLAMQAAADVGVTFMVLDRPNPQGGGPVSGFMRADGYESFVSQYPIPVAYGLTAGELAKMIMGQQWVGDLSGLDLQIVKMPMWRRSHVADVGAAWVPPSPGLPTAHSARVYPGTVLFEATTLSVGRGTGETFARIGAPWIDAEALVADLTGRRIPGAAFESVQWTPEPAAVGTPRFLGTPISGVRIVITDSAAFRPVEVGMHLLTAIRDHDDARAITGFIDAPEFFDLLAGSSRLRTLLLRDGASAREIIAAWADEAVAFDQLRSRYELYE